MRGGLIIRFLITLFVSVLFKKYWISKGSLHFPLLDLDNPVNLKRMALDGTLLIAAFWLWFAVGNALEKFLIWEEQNEFSLSLGIKLQPSNPFMLTISSVLLKPFFPKQINVCLVWLYSKKNEKRKFIQQLTLLVPLILIYRLLYLTYRDNRKGKGN